MSALIIVTIGIVLLFFFGFRFYLIRLAQPTVLLAWYVDLSSNLLSLGAAIAIGFWVYSEQSLVTSQNERDGFRIGVAQEIAHLYDVFEASPAVRVTTASGRYYVVVTYAQPVLLEKAAASGRFSPAQTHNWLVLADEVRAYNAGQQLLFAAASIATPETKDDAISFALHNMETTRERILTRLREEALRSPSQKP